MWGQSKQASSALMAMIYVTVGALVDVWTVIAYIYLSRHDGSDSAFLWCHGFFFSGLVLFVLGLALGPIGRAARDAEVAAPSPVTMVTAPAAASAPVGNAASNGTTAPVAPSAPPAVATPVGNAPSNRV